MVRKTGKHGVRSGNSFKFGGTLHLARHAKDEHVLIKQLTMPHAPGADSEAKETKAAKAFNQFVNDGNIAHQIAESNRHRWFQRYDQIYSMNKRKRWLIPSLINDTIDEIKDHRESEFRLTLVKRIMSPAHSSSYYRGYGKNVLQNTCTEYHDSNLDNPHQLARSAFSFEADLKRAGQLKEKHKSKKRFQNVTRRSRHVQRPHLLRESRDQDTNQTDRARVDRWIFRAHRPLHSHEDVKVPSVRYEVCYPGKLIGCKRAFKEHTLSQTYHRYYGNKSSKSFCKWKGEFRSRIRDFAYDIDEGKDIYEYGLDYEYNWDCYEFDQSKNKSFDMPVPVMITERKRSQWEKKQRKKKALECEDTITIESQEHKKKKLVYIDKLKESDKVDSSSQVLEWSDSDISSDLFSDSESDEVLKVNDGVQTAIYALGACITVPPAKVLLSAESISESSLVSTWGDDYQEGYSFPRRFTLDVKYKLKSCDAGKGEQTWITVEVASASDALEGVVCGVSIESDAFGKETQNALHSEIEIAPVSNSWHLLDLVDWILNKIKSTIPSDNANTNSRGNNSRTRLKRFSFYEKLLGWSSEPFTVGDAYAILMDEPLNPGKSPGKRLNSITSIGDSVSVADEEFCDICYDCITSDGDGLFSGTALRGCTHWFCNQCWDSHLRERVKQGDVCIKCPAFKCESVVDHVTLLWLMGYEMYTKHMDHIQDMKLERSPLWNWCPNTHCGRVVRIQKVATRLDVEGQTIECACGTRWCFSCQKEAHWPSTCKQADTFRKLVQTKGDEEAGPKDMTYFVEVKKCPQCKQPINKNGGCQHMVCCRCYTEFCWECLGLWHRHSNLVCSNARVDVSTVEIDQNQHLALGEQFYLKAVSHRRYCRRWRDQPALKALYSTVNAIRKSTRRRSCDNWSGKEQRGGSLSPVVETGWMVSQEEICTTKHKFSQIYGMEKDTEFLLSVKILTLQIHFLLEQVYVIMSYCGKTRLRLLNNKVESLEHIHHLIDQIWAKTNFKIETHMDDLEMLALKAKEIMQALIVAVQIVQRKLHQKEQKKTVNVSTQSKQQI